MSTTVATPRRWLARSNEPIAHAFPDTEAIAWRAACGVRWTVLFREPTTSLRMCGDCVQAIASGRP